MGQFTYNTQGIRISTCIIALLVIGYFFNIKPKFVVPTIALQQNKVRLYRIIVSILIIAITLLPLNVQFLTGKKLIREKYLPIQILFDVSLSMTASDIQPSRFVAAKNAVLKLMHRLEGYNMSVILFSGLPFVYVPFSNNTDAIIDKFESTNLGDFPPTPNFVGTAIGDAMVLGIENLENVKVQDNQPGIIILLTDGDSNKGYDPMQVVPIAQKKGIPVFTLGIGEQDYTVGYDHRGNQVNTSINIPLLQNISSETNGRFYRVLETNTFDQIFERIASMVKAQEKEKVVHMYTSINTYLLRIILICGLILLGYKQENFHKIQ